MKLYKLLSAIVIVSFFILSGCEEDTDSKINPNLGKGSTQLSPASGEKIDNLPALSPGLEAKFKALEMHPEYRNLVLQALNAVEPTPCDDNTLIDQYLDQQLDDWNSEIIGYVLDYAILDLPTYDALVFENSSEDQYFGVNGEYTKQLTKAFKDLRRFWDIQSDDIVLVAMHGDMLLDRDKIIRTYVAVYGLEPSLAALLADVVVQLVEEIPQYRGGNHPIFTFNAFAFSGLDFSPYAIIPPKIVMGDGIMMAYTELGFEKVAPQAILAHEFAHQIQYELELFEEENSPEATRRTELMADAYAAYYLSHARGATMQWKRVQQFLEVFYSIGDCGFDDDGHHGTPAQRMAAAEWGYQLADNAQKQGHILSAQEFADLFDAQLDLLVSL